MCYDGQPFLSCLINYSRNSVDTLTQIFSFMLHIDQQMQGLIAQYGVYIYAILFFVIFGETGFVVFPFLPGDSLLFIAGAFALDGSVGVDVSVAWRCGIGQYGELLVGVFPWQKRL